MRSLLRVWVGGLVLFSVLAWGRAPAHASDAAEDKLIRQGVEARRRQDDATALNFFQQAYALHHSPRAAAQMGLAEIALGRWPEGAYHLEEAIAARSDPWIQKNAKSLEDMLLRAQREVGRLEVLGSPAGAEVVIGGAVLGTLPLDKPIRVRAGDVQFQLRAPGYIPETRAVHVPAGELTRETVTLSALLPPSAPLPVAPGPSASIVRPVAPEEPPTTPHAGAALRTTGLILTSTGVVAIGAGVALGLKARSTGTDASQAGKFDPSAETAGYRYENLQWVGYGVGAALLAGGVITYTIGALRARHEATTVGLVAAPGGAVAVLGGTL